MKINLGDKARDLVTGFEGICVARTQWLNGCVRCTIQPQGLDKDGKAIDTLTIDEPQLHLLSANVVPVGNPDTGGPHRRTEAPRFATTLIPTAQQGEQQ